ncbi:MAG: hypothetical protein H6821_07930 [Planctomycetaceae bacterium]|nr:hypothetical protein [Planctomycetales bacterium]MCB9874095.1 hypothetical protein [Planctomycetaceae bacterium]MCB9940548.1 hypothetical protein [Planctomycetaceae bacterium]HRX78026.1 hypothetical protein [Pirellulaceae bacterium]
MSRTDDNPLLLLANSTLPGAVSSGFRRRTSRSSGERRRIAYHLHVEQLEPRHMLSAMAELIELDVWCDPEAVPAVLTDTECIARDVVDLSRHSPHTPADFEADDDVSCDPNDDPSARQASPQQSEDLAIDSNESFVESGYTPINEEFHALTSATPVGGELERGEVAVSDSGTQEPVQAVSIPPQRTLVQGVSDDTRRDVARPAALLQQPVYFSGTTALSGPNWKASTEELVNADTLLDVIGFGEPDNVSFFDKAVRVAVPSEVAVANYGFDPIAEVFSQVESWTVHDELPRSHGQPVISASLQEQEESHPQRLCLQELAPGEPIERPVMNGEEASRTKELLTASAPSPMGRLPSWQLLGGMGLWQIIVSVRGRRQKQRCEELS